MKQHLIYFTSVTIKDFKGKHKMDHLTDFKFLYLLSKAAQESKNFEQKEKIKLQSCISLLLIIKLFT